MQGTEAVQLFVLLDQNSEPIAFSTTFGIAAPLHFSAAATVHALLLFASSSRPTTAPDYDALRARFDALPQLPDAVRVLETRAGPPLSQAVADPAFQSAFTAMVAYLDESARSRAAEVPNAFYSFDNSTSDGTNLRHKFVNEGYRCGRLIRRTKYGDAYFYEVLNDSMTGPRYDLLEWSLNGGSLLPGEGWEGDFVFNEGLAALDYFIVGPSFQAGNNELSKQVVVGGNPSLLDTTGDLWLDTVWRYFVGPLFSSIVVGSVALDSVKLTPNIMSAITVAFGPVGLGSEILNEFNGVSFAAAVHTAMLSLAKNPTFWAALGVNVANSAMLAATIRVATSIVAVLAVINGVPNINRCFQTMASSEAVVKVPVPKPTSVKETSASFATEPDAIYLYPEWDGVFDETSPSVKITANGVESLQVLSFGLPILRKSGYYYKFPIALQPNTTHTFEMEAISKSSEPTPRRRWDITIGPRREIRIEVKKPWDESRLGGDTWKGEAVFTFVGSAVSYPYRGGFSSESQGYAVLQDGDFILTATGTRKLTDSTGTVKDIQEIVPQQYTSEGYWRDSKLKGAVYVDSLDIEVEGSVWVQKQTVSGSSRLSISDFEFFTFGCQFQTTNSPTDGLQPASLNIGVNKEGELGKYQLTIL